MSMPRRSRTPSTPTSSMSSRRDAAHSSRPSRKRSSSAALVATQHALGAVRLVPVASRDPERARVVGERRRRRLGGAEPGEPEVQQRGAHLGAVPATVLALGDPRAGLERPQRREVLGHEAARANGPSVALDRQVDVPRLGRGVGAAPRPEAVRLALARRLGCVGPRHAERHLGRVVDRLRDQRGELVGEGVVDVAQGEDRRAHLEVEQRPVRMRHRTSLIGGCLNAGVGFTRAELESFRDATVDDLVGPACGCCSSASIPVCGPPPPAPTSPTPATASIRRCAGRESSTSTSIAGPA